MSTHLEDRLSGVLADAADAAPVPGYDPVDAVRGRQRRRRNRHVAVAAACAVAGATAGSVAVVRAAVATVDHRVGSVASPGRIPDLANLARPAEVGPRGVHRLPAKLPDGSDYTVAQVIGDDRYLVVRSIRSAAPSVYDRRAGTVTDLATPAKLDGLADTTFMMARVVGERVVWFVDGWRRNQGLREAWMVPLSGGTPVRLESMADGAAPRFMVVGNAIAWEQQVPGSAESPGGPRDVIRTVSLDGGAPHDIPGTEGFSLAQVAPWITNQKLATGVTPKSSGELRNVATGERLRWTANSKIQFLRCGPAWCAGTGYGGGVALQRLDGTGYTELPYSGSLAPTADGRLAVGGLKLPSGDRQVVWDQTTGRAAAYAEPRPEGPLKVVTGAPLSDFEPPVLTWRPDGGTLMVLDLTAIR
ncbi:hypothetical protein K1W54_06055 [Micromonospora sp. CPCC 205371]|nr:hypothetical protein [Micromonospora sp. CPCC 205371]